MRTMDRRIARAGRWIVAAGSVMAVSGAAVALAATSNQATTTVSPSSVGSVTAKCKSGEVALAGGFETPGWNPATANGGPVARFSSAPVASQRGITTTGFNFNENDTQELRSFAYCGKRANPPTVRTKRVQVQSNNFNSATATCPEGRRAIGGGFGTDGSVITLTSKRSGAGGWKVLGVNIPDLGGGSGPASLTAYAYCKSPGPKLVTASKDTTLSSDFVTTTVPCPNGGRALSGGFDGHFKVVNNEIRAAGALDSKRDGPRPLLVDEGAERVVPERGNAHYLRLLPSLIANRSGYSGSGAGASSPGHSPGRPQPEWPSNTRRSGELPS